MSIPKDIRYDIARAEGYLQKNDLPMALESVATALRHMSSQHVASVGTVERHINTMLARITAQPALQTLLDPHQSGQAPAIIYQYGKEGALTTVLREFAKILRERQQKTEEFYEKRDRLQELLQKGLSLIEEGQKGTGASFLQRAAKEYAHEAHTIVSIGQALVHYEQYATAAKVYHDGIKHHPKNKDFYSQAIKAYTLTEDYAGAIHVFHRALQQFGRHPRSVAKLAELYLLWDKEEEAQLLAQEALEMDATESLALDIEARIEAREEEREMQALALEEERLRQKRAQERAQQKALEESSEENIPSENQEQYESGLDLNLHPVREVSIAQLSAHALTSQEPSPKKSQSLTQTPTLAELLDLANPLARAQEEDMGNGPLENSPDESAEADEVREPDTLDAPLDPQELLIKKALKPITDGDMVQGLAQDVLLSFQDVATKKRS